MDRVPNEVVWAVIASIVCGLVIVSLLGGVRTPWLLVLAVIGLGYAATTIRRRRGRARYAKYRYEPMTGSGAPARTRERPRTVATESRVATGLAPTPTGLRRAGTRSESLGAKPRRDRDPSR